MEPETIAELVTLVDEGTINATSAKIVLEHVFRNGGSPKEVVKELDLAIIQDPEILRRSVKEILESSPDQVDTYLSGKEGVSQWFFGQVMSVTGGRADPSVVHQILNDELKELKSRQGEG